MSVSAGRRSPPELADRQTSGVELRGDFRPAEHNAQSQVDALVAEKAFFLTQPQLQSATIGGYAIFDCGWHLRLALICTRQLLAGRK